jgi:catechol 2,3-dioxygenase-like lactoylglutathione lyase family enzyme
MEKYNPNDRKDDGRNLLDKRGELMEIKYVHTNLIAKDWRRLAHGVVFGCEPVGPERNLSGEWIDTATGLRGVHIGGAHLRLPGYEKDGPTLEIFQYQPERIRVGELAINQPGYGHLAFLVDSVAEVVAMVLAQGGSVVSEIVQREYAELGTLIFVYARDPEGNLIEIQHWRK